MEFYNRVPFKGSIMGLPFTGTMAFYNRVPLKGSIIGFPLGAPWGSIMGFPLRVL